MVVRFLLTWAAVLSMTEQGWPDFPQEAGQDAPITVGPNVHVSRPRAKFAHAEVILAADPNARGRLLAGSIIEQPLDGPSVVVYSSLDSGKTWELAFEKKAKKGGPNFLDPTVAFGPDGAAYFAAIELGSCRFEIVASRDGGRSWEGPVIMARPYQDRPFLAVDCTNGMFRGRIYCTCCLDQHALGVWTSHDGGKTFDSQSLAINDGRAPFAGPSVVLSDGTLVMPYGVRIPPADGHSRVALRLRRSTTGGESFLEEQALLVREYLWHRSIPMLAVDPGSKAFKDRLYLVWQEKTSAGMRVMFMLSKDKGVNWTHPVIISEQSDAKDGAKGKSYHSLLPSVAVNKAGVVGVSWYDTRDSPEEKPRCNVRFRASLDGGTTWLPSVRVTDVASAFDVDNLGGAIDKPGNWLGHTAGLAADAGGTFHPLWVDLRKGIMQVFTASVSVKGTRPE